MSLTVIALIAMGASIVLGISIMFAGYDDLKGTVRGPAKIIATLMATLAAASLVVSIASFNSNIREARESCLDRGGVVYSNSSFEACFDRYPVELQKI